MKRGGLVSMLTSEPTISVLERESEANDGYRKASDVDAKAQAHNLGVFREEMRKSPWRVLALALAFDAIASVLVLYGILEYNNRVRAYLTWSLAVLTFCLGSYFMWMAFVDAREQRSAKP